MSPYLNSHQIIDSTQFDQKLYQCDISNVEPLGYNKELITYSHLNQDRQLNISIPIALAVTAYARMVMAKYKLLLSQLGYTIFYSDTDSLFIDRPLNSSLIGKN